MVVIGSDEATVKIKVFSSLTCPHCADFHIKVVPKIKNEYVDTGKIKIVFRDFPVVQAVVMISAGIVITTSLLVDIAYAYLDPRIRLQ